jgi:hypothetical protein
VPGAYCSVLHCRTRGASWCRAACPGKLAEMKHKSRWRQNANATFLLFCGVTHRKRGGGTKCGRSEGANALLTLSRGVSPHLPLWRMIQPTGVQAPKETKNYLRNMCGPGLHQPTFSATCRVNARRGVHAVDQTAPSLNSATNKLNQSEATKDKMEGMVFTLLVGVTLLFCPLNTVLDANAPATTQHYRHITIGTSLLREGGRGFGTPTRSLWL